jgi:hypothetical protein
MSPDFGYSAAMGWMRDLPADLRAGFFEGGSCQVRSTRFLAGRVDLLDEVGEVRFIAVGGEGLELALLHRGWLGGTAPQALASLRVQSGPAGD